MVYDHILYDTNAVDSAAAPLHHSSHIYRIAKHTGDGADDNRPEWTGVTRRLVEATFNRHTMVNYLTVNIQIYKELVMLAWSRSWINFMDMYHVQEWARWARSDRVENLQLL
jgi:hypothetical protein